MAGCKKKPHQDCCEEGCSERADCRRSRTERVLPHKFPPNWRLENLYNLVGQDSAEMVHKSSGCGNEMFVQHESTGLAREREAGVAAITIMEYLTVTQLRHAALDFPM